MDKDEKLLRIRSLLIEKKKEEDAFRIKIEKINEEMYSKQINPLLIKFLNFTSSSIEKLQTAILKAGGKFDGQNFHFTREQLEKGYQILEKEHQERSLFFEIFDATFVEYSDISNLYEFLDQIEEIVKDLEFVRKHSYLGENVEQMSFRKYLKVVYDNRIEILKRPLEHLEYLKIHGIWEIMENGEGLVPPINEPSTLLAHCTKSHESYWPIISEGLRISKSYGGRCGRGIYFSNDVSKCLQYSSFTSLDKNITFGLIFFSQVYTGKVRKIVGDNGSLTKSLEYDSVHAIGTVSPKMNIDIWHSDNSKSTIFIDAPSNTGVRSSFNNNEFVIYDENRSRLRYIILISKPG